MKNTLLLLGLCLPICSAFAQKLCEARYVAAEGASIAYNVSALGPDAMRTIQNRVDRVQWVNSLEGLDYLAVRQPDGTWAQVTTMRKPQHPDDAVAVTQYQGQKLATPLNYKNSFGFRVRNAERSGSLVAVKRSDGEYDVGEVIFQDGDKVGVRVGSLVPGEGLVVKKYPIAAIAESGSRKSIQDGQRNVVENPTSLPDGVRLVSRSDNGFTLVIDRKNDAYLRDFLQARLPEVKEKSLAGARPNALTKAKRTFDIVRHEIEYAARQGPEQTPQAARYHRHRLEAGFENRGMYAGEALSCGAGQCKDFAVLASILLGDTQTTVRYQRGDLFDQSGVKVGGHSWLEFNDEAGNLYAMDPTRGIGPTPEKEFYRTKQYVKKPVEAELYRF